MTRFSVDFGYQFQADGELELCCPAKPGFMV